MWRTGEGEHKRKWIAHGVCILVRLLEHTSEIIVLETLPVNIVETLFRLSAI